MNKNWPRWIYVAASKHFYENRGEIPLLIEGQSRSQDPNREMAEFRMNGPIYTNPSAGYWIIDVNIETFLSIAHNEQDSHKVQRVIGQFSSIYPSTINVFKYGDGGEDDPSQHVGCLVMHRDRGDMLVVNNFGMISADIPIYQVSIDASYKMEISL